jgi:hypothetical protein
MLSLTWPSAFMLMTLFICVCIVAVEYIRRGGRPR